ncbi:MAG: cation:proton antiporter, partial [Candidatus Methanomethylophilaceae archaeon]|nr:cation:proton antiporter [Candidatus Methanomethylophilaceae archaeon]
MDEIVLMTSLALFLLLAAVCSIVFNKLKFPPLIGYLVAGIIVSNFLEVDESGETIVEILSNMGLITLMFCIGMEIDLKKIKKQGMFAIEVALVQLPLMVLGGVVAGTLMGFNMIQSICLGGIISGSSTAVVMAVLKNQNRLDKDHIDTIVLITIIEDIGQVIILSMITPLMAGTELDSNGLIAMVISIIAFMIISIAIGLRFIPHIMNWVSDNVSSEVLVILSVGMAFGMALVANFAGLSVAIGAFLMGMMISSCKKSKEISHDIEPMK